MKSICYVVTIPTTIRTFFTAQLLALSEEFKVTVICSMDEKLQTELEDKIRFIPVNIPRGVAFHETFEAIVSLKRIFKREIFDLVQYSTPNAAFCASIASLSAGIKVRNYHLMGLRFMGNRGVSKLVLKTLEKISCSCSTNIECVSQSNYKFGIQERLYNLKKATVVWHGSTGGVDLERFNSNKRVTWRGEIREKLRLTDADFVFGFIGRITKDKGINELLESFYKLDKPAKLVLIGSDEGVDTLTKDLWRKAKNNKNIFIIDWVRDIERYYAAIDVLVLPSYREGFGNVIIEAGAMKTPVIASDIPGPKDVVVDDKTGLLCRAMDVNSLKKCMEKIMENQAYKRLGENAKRYIVTRYDSRVMCEKILERKKNLLRC